MCTLIHGFVDIWQHQAPDSEPSLTPVFLSSTCFRPPGAAQQQSDFLNFTSGSVWKWRLQWRIVQEAQWNDLLHTARLLIRLDTPLHGNNARGAKYAVYYASVATHTVFENIKMAALRAMSEEKCCSPFPCFFIPWQHAYYLILSWKKNNENNRIRVTW